jgi:TolA-binding protein
MQNLQKDLAWSKIIRDDFFRGNLETQDGGLVKHHTFETQINKLNQEVARLIHAKTEMQAQLLQIAQRVEATSANLQGVKDQLKTWIFLTSYSSSSMRTHTARHYY